MLSFDNVSLSYGLTRTSYEPARAADGKAGFALQNVSLEVPAGQSLAIIGPSGCGKSSLLRLAAGLATPSSGHVSVQGETLKKPRKQTALILQNYGLLPWRTVHANVELGLRIQKTARSERAARVGDALRRVGLTEAAQKYPAQLSGGMQQRVALARALAQDADLLLMDEPMSALDTLLREELQDTLLNLWKEKRYTQIIVTHSLEEAVYLGQRIAVMGGCPGRITTCIENPLMGSPCYRTTQEFFEQCKTVRAALEHACADGENNPTEALHA